MTATWTCQVCARPIKAARGLIAHHGYRRPWHGSGYQTASCMGARYVPFEVGCDRLREVAELVRRDVEHLENWLASFIAEPPAELKYRRWDDSPEKVVARPEGFAYEPYGPRTGWGGTYEWAFSTRVMKTEANLRMMRADLVEMNRRLEAWTPPAAAKEVT